MAKECNLVNHGSRHGRIHKWIEKVRRLLKREPESPDDPYAMVGAPKKPRLPHRSAAAAEPLE
ncbi:MAG: hypothetical protein LAQ69_27545 [Acidobacteriia bacterium]|nr:hypothetical protein [Terriglobia bacterium]